MSVATTELGPTELGPFGLRLREALAVWMTEDLERLCAAIGGMGYNALLELIEEEGSEGEDGWVPAWGKLLNVELCPADNLRFLAQWVGVEVPKGAGEEEARALIREQPARLRGTAGAIETAIRRNLSGNKAFTLIERRNAEGVEDAYRFIVVVAPGELPSEAALVAAVNAVKPAGVFWTLIVTEGHEWVAATRTWAEDTLEWPEYAHTNP